MKYKYSALDQSGKTLSGYIQAEGIGNARTEIRRKGLYVVDIKEIANRTERKTKLFWLGIRHKLPMQLARQLSSLLRGGVPLFQALMIIANQMTAPKENEVVSYLRDQVKEGAPLSEALKYYPKIFDELFVYSVQAGERSGALDAILTYQADLLENRAVLRGKIKTALIYPIIMAFVGGGVLLFLMTYVVPMVMKIFERMNQELPLSTRVLIGVAHFINNYLFICIIGIAIIMVILSQLMKKNQQYRVMWENFLLKLPLFSDLYTMILANHFARIMATLLRSGVAMVQSIMIASRAIKSSVVSDNVVKMAEMVQGGADLSAALRGTETFPPYVADMVAVGENTGNVEEMLAKVSDYYEMNVNQRLATFTSMVEPVIILVMGAIVAFVLVSILLPLFDMNKILVK